MLDREWLDRLECERRCGNVPACQALVLRALWVLVLSGDHEPSEARLASEAGVSRATVQRAKRTGQTLGLLEWQRQWRTEGELRRERPCAYRVELPAGPVVRKPRREHQPAQRAVSLNVQQQLATLPPITEAMRAMVAERWASMATTGHRR